MVSILLAAGAEVDNKDKVRESCPPYTYISSCEHAIIKSFIPAYMHETMHCSTRLSGLNTNISVLYYVRMVGLRCMVLLIRAMERWSPSSWQLERRWTTRTMWENLVYHTYISSSVYTIYMHTLMNAHMRALTHFYEYLTLHIFSAYKHKYLYSFEIAQHSSWCRYDLLVILE